MRALFLSLAMAGTSAMAGLRCASRRRPRAELDHLQTGGQLRCKPPVNFPCKRVVNFPGTGWSTSLQTGGQLLVQSSNRPRANTSLTVPPPAGSAAGVLEREADRVTEQVACTSGAATPAQASSPGTPDALSLAASP